jgi:hypothetical protein
MLARSLAQEVLKVELLISLSLWIFNYNFVDKPGRDYYAGRVSFSNCIAAGPSMPAGLLYTSPLWNKKKLFDGCRGEGVNFDQGR